MRSLAGLTITVLFLSTFSSGIYAQEEANDEVLASAGDRFPIYVTYYPALADAVSGGLENAPVVVLLHGEKESRLVWNKGSAPRGTNPFPAELQKRGYAVVTVDLRKHGESVGMDKDTTARTDDYPKMVLGDMKAVKDFIQEEHQKQRLNMRKMGIVGSGFSAAVAAEFAEYDWRQEPYDDHALRAKRTPRGQDVQALILISPASGAGRLRTSRAIGFLKNPALNVALQIIVGEEDASNYRTARTLYQNFTSIKGNEERAEIIAPKLKDTGIALLRHPTPIAYIPMLKFLDDNLKSRNFPWQDRRSKLVR